MDRETNKISKKKNVKKHKLSKRKKHHDTSGEESIDLSEKIYPIAHYINDREEMIQQVFSVMEKEKLNCMLPPILKGMTIEVLKEKCLKELTKMSDDEVRKVLCGETIEASTKKVPGPTNIDSDTCQSLSSVEECNNTEKEKRTLLDILEQEMQEIAYNTVLKRAEKPETESDDGLPEIVAITPTHSPSRATNNVLLICIDSGDDEPSKCVSEPVIGNNILKQLDNHDVVCEGGTDVLCIPNTSANTETVNLEKNTASFVNIPSTSPSKPPPEINHSNLGHISKATNSQESLTIQVFSKNMSSERIVKKVCKLSNSDPDLGKNPIVNTVNSKADDLVTDSALFDCDKNILFSENSQNVVEVLTTVPANEVEEIQIIDENITAQQSSKEGSQFCDTSISQLVDSCISLQNSIKSIDPQYDEVTLENKAEEKEEGEITEEESEEEVEVLETSEEQHQSSTIFLSSDDDVKSDLSRLDQKNKVRKHHHRSKGSKRNNVSPERSRRRIEKRGNRSYRRKTTSTVKESQRHNEKEKGATPDNHSLSNSTQIPDEVTLESHPAETESTLSEKDDSSQVVEEMETEICDPSTSPNTLEIHISDTKLDSSEETEGTDSAEPVSTKTSWADRWAEKKDLKKVVITSKICQNVRKRILSARRKQANPEPATTQTAPLPPVPPLVLHVEGSVQEYQMLQLLDTEERNEPNPSVLDLLPHGKDFEVVSSVKSNHDLELPDPNLEEANQTE
ncbi:slender lobes-like protein [Thrips palmi]|uniref:Slender lobes-like protein n=1 Tax=Thrips palmi TaxID=161013 RepID=A0A6P8YY61_THRPL|nr:slender lobes-like protein [Thrips palmi]